MSLLHVDSVMKSYGLRAILTDVYLYCKKGEVVGLLGRNGCGKSTLLKIIFGSLSAEYRFVKVGDKQIRNMTNGYKHIRYLPQDGFLPNNIKIRTIIDMFCAPRWADKVAGHPIIEPSLDKKSKELSGGERRFFEILLMIYADAEFVMIDEPFNGLSPIRIEEIKGLIREQSPEKGFIITDHDYRNILNIASRIMLIHEGAIKNIKDSEELRHWGYIP